MGGSGIKAFAFLLVVNCRVVEDLQNALEGIKGYKGESGLTSRAVSPGKLFHLLNRSTNLDPVAHLSVEEVGSTIYIVYPSHHPPFWQYLRKSFSLLDIYSYRKKLILIQDPSMRVLWLALQDGLAIGDRGSRCSIIKGKSSSWKEHERRTRMNPQKEAKIR